MEVGVRSGAHFQFFRQLRTNAMKTRLILLFTRDRAFDQLVSEALGGNGAIVLIARSVGDALQIVSQRGRELDFAVMDFDSGCRGMTLLSAVHTCLQQLPILVTTSGNIEDVSPVAYANGARACLNKPLPSTRLASAISELVMPHQMVAA